MTFPFIFQTPRVVGTVSSTDHAVDTSDASAYTFTSKAIGTARIGRMVIVGVAGLNGTAARTMTSVTIGGVTATQCTLQHTNDGTNFTDVGFYAAYVDTGTTGTIVVTWSAGQIRCGIGVWAAYSIDSSTPTATVTSTANPMTNSLAVSAGGIILGVAMAFQNSAVPTYTWAGLTERYDETVEPNSSHTGADLSSAAGSASVTCTATPSTFTGGLMVVSAFR